MLTRKDPKIDTAFGHRLVEEGFLVHDEMEKALSLAKNDQKSLAEVLCLNLDFNPTRVYETYAKHLSIPFQNLKDTPLATEAIKRIPIKVATHYGFVPIDYENNRIVVAASYPMNIKTQDEINLHIGCPIRQVLAHPQDMEEAIARFYGMSANTVDQIVAKRPVERRQDDVRVNTVLASDSMAQDRTVINLVNEIILEAYRRRATDIHLEPYRGKFRLRYRIDGVLHDANLSQKASNLILPIISRIKIMSNLDIVEHRLPQDGRAIIQLKKEKLDLRISCIPTPVGESVVIRVLKTELTLDLERLGLRGSSLKLLKKLIQKPHGVILLTGPTGSGKTTTLYACLNDIKSDDKKIISLEDPIEYEIPGITQVQVQPKVGLNFSQGLRSMLRHDPDIMMVGEIRDQETAEIAIRAALTGHLIFSTLHTNDSASGVTRLLEIGVEPYLVASSVEAIIAQRLVRVICKECHYEIKDGHEAIRHQIANYLKIDYEEVRLAAGQGCDVCNGTGFYGRTAIHEILVVSEEIKSMIYKDCSTNDIKQQGLKEGVVTLLQDGWEKVMAGITTAEEVIEVAQIGVSDNA